MLASNNTNKQSLSEVEKKHVSALLQALEAFLQMRHDMPLRYATAFLSVAEEEGLPVSEYAKRSNVSPSVMSRHILDIGDRDRYMDEGMGLVTKRQDPMELRTHRVFLTDKGRALARTIFRALGR